MRNWSELRGLMPSIVLGVVSTAALGYSTNKVTGVGPTWWWAVLGVSLIGLVAAGLWGHRVHQRRSPVQVEADTVVEQRDHGVVQQRGSGAQQSAGDHGTNVVMSADNHGVAVWKVDTLNMGTPPHAAESENQNRS
jgi:hypothetical protein